MTIGQTQGGLTLTVANLFFDQSGEDVIRLISARRAQLGSDESIRNRSDWDEYELPDEYDFRGKYAVIIYPLFGAKSSFLRRSNVNNVNHDMLRMMLP